MSLRKINKGEFTPLSLAERFCETIMSTYTADNLPPWGGWHYPQGLLLLGMEKIFFLTGKQKYVDYIKEYADSFIDAEGHIEYNKTFDDAMSAFLLYRIYEETGDERYKKVLDEFISWVPEYNRTPSGGFWHKMIYPDQMWLDGLFMAQPLCVRYAKTFGGRDDLYETAFEQFTLMKKYTRDDETGLWYHAYDESRKAPWSDPVTGRSPEFWGRALGWIGPALLFILDYLPEDNEHRDYFIETLRDYVEAVARVQDEKSGMWFQLLNRHDDPDNWIETSCSCLFMHTMAKGMRLGYLDKKYISNVQRAYDGLFDQLETDEEGKIYINNICVGTSAGVYEEYLARPRVVNDSHGSGAFLLALSEVCEFVK